ncbi:MAG: phage holin family protein [Peptococcaceae bacterium]|nr:phage holin family protein [Peptococcaceae bacterium]
MPQQLFSALEQAVSTSEGKALYILVLICIAMILDFLLGSFAAWRDPQVKFTSQRGIDGILRKLASILVLVCCIPVSALVPAEAGLAALIVLYLGYLFYELASVIENLERLGAPVSGLQKFIENISEIGTHNDESQK